METRINKLIFFHTSQGPSLRKRYADDSSILCLVIPALVSGRS